MEIIIWLWFRRAWIPKDHWLRRRYKGWILDPVQRAALGLVFAGAFLVFGITFLVRLVRVLSEPKTDVTILMVYLFLGAMVCGFCAAIMGTAACSFPKTVKGLCAVFKFPPQLLGDVTREWLTQQSEHELRRLAQGITDAEAMTNPASESAERARIAFRTAYTLFRDAGLIEDVGYGRFFTMKQSA